MLGQIKKGNPPIPPEFFLNLISFLQKFQLLNGLTHLVFYCFGGKGEGFGDFVVGKSFEAVELEDRLSLLREVIDEVGNAGFELVVHQFVVRAGRFFDNIVTELFHDVFFLLHIVDAGVPCGGEEVGTHVLFDRQAVALFPDPEKNIGYDLLGEVFAVIEVSGKTAQRVVVFPEEAIQRPVISLLDQGNKKQIILAVHHKLWLNWVSGNSKTLCNDLIERPE